MKLVTRQMMGWPRTTAAYAPCDAGLVLHYDGANQGLASKPHARCIKYWTKTREFHMNGRGWQDIGYSYGVCPHGYVFEGRGFEREQAAQPGGNSTWTSCTLMSGPDEKPTEGQINAVVELRGYLMELGLHATIRGHFQFIDTSCPGPIIKGMIADGTFSGMVKAVRELPVIKEGITSYDVKTARALMWARGFGKQDGTAEEIIVWLRTMEFTPSLTEYTKAFQTARKLSADGVIGPKTWLKLERR